MSKIMTAKEAAKEIESGNTLMIGGFGSGGFPARIIGELCNQEETKDLTIYVNSPTEKSRPDLEKLLLEKSRHVKCTFMRSSAGAKLFSEGKLELVPQGTFAESLRMGGAGIPAYYTPVGVGTLVEKGKEIREFDGKEYLLEYSLSGDVAVFRVNIADRMGNCYMKGTTKNFCPLMAKACKKVFVEAERLVEVGEIDPELVTVPGIVVTGIVEVN